MSRNESIGETIQSLESSDSLLSWINDTLGAKEDDLATLDQHITHIVAALDIACEETSFQLERIIDDVSRGVPRLTYDLHFMKDSAMALQSVLVKTQDHSASSLPAQTNETLEHLRTLDTVKRHMESAREVLREAESWSSLEMEVTGLLGEGSYARAAERLSEASKSMVVFQNTPEYEPRRTLMASLSNLIVSVLTALQPSFSERLAALFEQYGSSALLNCITTLKVTQDFAVNVEKVMDKVKLSIPTARPHGQDGAADSVETASRERAHRRRSSRMSISWHAGSQRATQGSVGSLSLNVTTHDDFEWGRELSSRTLTIRLVMGNWNSRCCKKPLIERLPMRMTATCARTSRDFYGKQPSTSLALAKKVSHDVSISRMVMALSD
ncbi:Golgi complex component domain-containing protein [Salix suchowensis]|nr:Golgi complex component domain-containing protein [Salix suchowensis]